MQAETRAGTLAAVRAVVLERRASLARAAVRARPVEIERRKPLPLRDPPTRWHLATRALRERHDV